MKSNSLQQQVSNSPQKQKQTYQSAEEVQEMLLQELENLFDKPVFVSVQAQPQNDTPSSRAQQQQNPQQQTTTFKILFEKDYSNTFLITNPMAIFKVFAKDQFLGLPESTQCILLERLEDILQKCAHNSLILTEHVFQQSVMRLNQQVIEQLAYKQKSAQQSAIEQQDSQRHSSSRQSLTGTNDLILLIIQLALKLSNKNYQTSRKLIDVLRKLTSGKRFNKCHQEYIYQYLKVKTTEKCKGGKSEEAMMKIEAAIKMISSMYEQRFDVGPSNYFYFSGYLSGIQVNTKSLPQSEFTKGFAAAMWFQLQDTTIQDDKNLPVLFNCFFQGYGGFECYFNQKQLFYRILPKVYTPPNVDSNGVKIGEFQAKKWYYFAIDHEKPFMTRPQFTAVINDKQVVTLPMDYPKIDKGAKISMIAICKNFIGQLSSFLLFKEQISNTKKLIQLYNHYEYGLHNNQLLQKLNAEIFDAKLASKLFILYCPERVSQKAIYDSIEMRDGELMINSGASHSGPKSKLFFNGGLNSLLPLLELVYGVTIYVEDSKSNFINIADIVNEYLKLVISVLSTKSFVQYEAENSNFFSVLFYLLGRLPCNSVNNQTISNLADIRFLIGDSKLQEQFFQSLMQSSDFWINTDNIEVLNEYWLFVKAIYQQNPIQYNKMFSIQKLIDLMVKISDIKDGHCCEYHRDTYLMFYQGIVQQHHPQPWQMIGGKERSNSLLVNEDKKLLGITAKNNSDLDKYNSVSQRQNNQNPFKPASDLILAQPGQSSKIHHLEKYLAPIAGVLEGVLTSGGNEVLDQIQYIAKALTVKSSPCFHLQMLKLLKVLLLDSKEDRHCASPGDFAAHLLKSKGLQILLYLCSNSSFDVKSMCVKLIDVLSSHTSLIKMAIDPDVITYLCNIILPRQMMEVASISQKNQMFKSNIETNQKMIEPSNQYQMVEELDEESQEDRQLNESKDLEDHIDQLLMGQQVDPQQQQYQSQQRKFGRGLFLEDEEEESKNSQNKVQLDNEQDEAYEIQPKGRFGNKNKVSMGGFIQEIEENNDFNQEDKQLNNPFDNIKQLKKKSNEIPDDGYDEELLQGKPPPPAPKSKAKPFSFDFDDDSNAQEKPDKKFNQTSKVRFGKQQQQIEEQDEEGNSDNESEDLATSSSQPKDFGIIGFKKVNSASVALDPKKKFMNTQKLPTLGGKQASTGMKQGGIKGRSIGLELDIEEDKFNEKVAAASRVARNTFSGGFQRKEIEFAEINDDNEELNEGENNFGGLGERSKKGKKETFANENVMSKSNLRQPKSFNFGFPEGEDSDEEEEEEKTPADIDNYEIEVQQNEEDDIYFQDEFFKAHRGKNPDVLEGGSFTKSTSSQPKTLNLHKRGKSEASPTKAPQEDEQEEEEEKQKPVQVLGFGNKMTKRNLVIGGTTGATSDTLQEKSHSRERFQDEEEKTQDKKTQPKKAVISFQKKAKLFTNANQKLNIDTEAINELFNYGGEKGQIMMTEDEELINLEKDIEELASMCLAAMNRKRPEDPIKYEGKREKTSFENKYLKSDPKGNENTKQKNPRQQFMTPQSVRGIKKIEFSMSQEEKNAALEGSKDRLNLGSSLGSSGLLTSKGGFGLKTGAFSGGIIQEELSPGNTSKSSSKHDFNNFGLQTSSSGGNIDSLHHDSQLALNRRKSKMSATHKTISTNELPQINELEGHHDFDSGIKRRLSDTDAHLESSYENRLMPFGQMDSGKVDEYTIELENLYTSCLEWIISRAPSNLYENIVIDECDKVGYQPAIQLMMTLVTYSNNIIRQRALNDLEMLAKWDSNNGAQIMTHPQFHTWLLELLMPYQDLASKYSKLQGTSRAVYDIGCKLHTLLLKNACINQEEEAYKKINFLSRWPQIISSQYKQGIKDRTERDIDTAHKLSRVLLTQLINSLKDEAQRMKPQNSKQISTAWHNLVYITYLIEEMILGSHHKDIQGNDGSEPYGEYNTQLFKWIQKEYLLYYYGSNESSLWAEWDMIEQVFQILDIIFPEWTMKQVSSSSRTPLSLDESIFQLLQKCSGDEFSAVVDILLHDGSPYKQSASSSSLVQNQSAQQKQSKKGKGIISNVLGGTSPLGIHFKSGTQSLSGQETAQTSQGSQVKGENSFMKIILNLICIALTQADTKQLVQLWLDRFERFIKYIMIVSETWKSRLVNTVYNSYQVKFSETITFAFTFLFHELHASQRVSTPTQQQNVVLGQTQFSSSSSPKDQMFNKLYAQSLKNLMIYFINIVEYSRIKYTPNQLETHITACRNIFHNYLIKTNYQGQSESLITFKDIARFKQSEYDDFPECFYLDDWKITFFYSETIKKIIKKQMNLEILKYYLHKRISYSQHYLETQMQNDKTKDDILRRMQCDTVDVIGLISEEEFERKNKVALMNDNFIREQGYFWSKAKKLLFGPKGIWRNIGDQYLKANLFRSNDGVRVIMSERYSNGFEFQESTAELERKIFNEVENSNCEMFMISKKQIQEVKAILSEQRKKLKRDALNSEAVTSEDRGTSGQGQNSDEDDDDNQEEEDDNEVPSQSHQKDHIIIQFFSRQLTTREKISLKKQYIAHLKEYIYTFRPKNKEIVELKCQILKPFYQRPGTIVLTSHDIIFFDDLYTPAAQIAEKDNIFFFKYQKKNDEIFYKIIGLPNLKEIQRRRWLGRKTALELFLMDGKTLMINFQNIDDREVFAKKIIRQRNQKCYNLRYYDTLDPRRILKKRELTEKWTQWKISNFEYIMQLNQLSGRSYNDLSQYPVFPWIIVDNQTSQLPDINNYSLQTGGVPPNGLRDLNKNMQLLGTAERQAEFKRKYDDSDSFNSLSEKFHCGSHYSNPGIVLHYLSRLSPYLDALVELHGKNLDTPDRGFHSVQESLVSALSDHSDVRELVPEFYFSPEIFMNMNKIKFGVKQDGTVVDNVKLPDWCNNDPYFYVVFLREAFESHYVSQNLGGWIDYIFGFKQRDAEAEKSLNVFSKLTYEDGIDIDAVQDQFLKQGYQEQIYHYGQTPSQLFQKQKHPQKLPKQQVIKYSTVVDNNSKIKVYKPVTQTQAAKNQQVQASTTQIMLTQEAILKAKFVDEQTIIGLSKDGTVTYFFWLSKAHELNPNTPFTCCEDKKRKFDNKSKYNDIEAHDRSIKKFDFPLLILHQTKCIMRGGFWGGKIAICPIEGISNEAQSSLQIHQSTVTVLVATQNEKLVISGSKNGDVVVWNYVGGAGNPNNEVNWQVRKHMCDHDGIISMIHINEEMCMYITCSYDGTANLYNLWTDKIQRTFKHPKLSPIHSVVLSQAPLPSVTFFSREDHYWHAYSLNGHFLDKQKEECSHIISPIVLKDSHFMEKMVYGTEKGYLIFRALPSLKQIKKQQVSTSYPVCSVIASSDRRFMLVGCGDGGMNVVTEPFQLQQNTQSQSSSSSTGGYNTAGQTQSTMGSQQFIQTQQITQQTLVTSQNVSSAKNYQTSSSHYRE